MSREVKQNLQDYLYQRYWWHYTSGVHQIGENNDAKVLPDGKEDIKKWIDTDREKGSEGDFNRLAAQVEAHNADESAKQDNVSGAEKQAYNEVQEALRDLEKGASVIDESRIQNDGKGFSDETIEQNFPTAKYNLDQMRKAADKLYDCIDTLDDETIRQMSADCLDKVRQDFDIMSNGAYVIAYEQEFVKQKWNGALVNENGDWIYRDKDNNVHSLEEAVKTGVVDKNALQIPQIATLLHSNPLSPEYLENTIAKTAKNDVEKAIQVGAAGLNILDADKLQHVGAPDVISPLFEVEAEEPEPETPVEQTVNQAPVQTNGAGGLNAALGSVSKPTGPEKPIDAVPLNQKPSAATKNVADTKNQGWFARNWQWLVGALAAAGLAAGAFFLIRKQKNKTKKANDDVASLQSQVEGLKEQANKLNDALIGVEQARLSAQKGFENEKTDSSSTLEKAASSVLNNTDEIMPQNCVERE